MQEKFGNQVKKNSTGQGTLCSRLTLIGSRMMQGVGYAVHIDPHMGRLISQVKPMSHNNVFKNHIGCPPPQHQERPGAKKNALEALSNMYELTFSIWGPTGRVT
jgi:hypothetical protein